MLGVAASNDPPSQRIAGDCRVRRRILKHEQISGLATEHLAELLERAGPNGPRPARLQHREVLRSDADVIGALVQSLPSPMHGVSLLCLHWRAHTCGTTAPRLAFVPWSDPDSAHSHVRAKRIPTPIYWTDDGIH